MYILYQIHLIDKCQNHTYYFVKSNSKENSLNCLVNNEQLIDK